MADFSSNLITKAEAAKSRLAAGLIDGDDKSGTLLLATVVYAFKGTEANNDTIQLVDLPAGAVVVPSLCSIAQEGLGVTALAISIGEKVGTVTMPTRYANAVAIGGASASVGFGVGGVGPAPLNVPAHVGPTRLGTLTRIYGTFSGKTGTITAGKTMQITIAYRVKG